MPAFFAACTCWSASMKPTSSALTSTLCGAPSPASTLVNARPAARVIEVGALRARGALGADIERVDDAPPAPRLHLRPGEPRQPDRREQLLIEILAPDVVGDLLERTGARGAGIVHDDVDLAERLHGLVIGPLDIRGNGDVALDGVDAPSSARTDGLGGVIECVAAARHDGDVGARGRKPRRDREPDPLAGAGNDGRAAGETDLHCVLPMAPALAARRDFLAPRRSHGKSWGAISVVSGMFAPL